MPKTSLVREQGSVLPFYSDLLYRGPEFDRLFEIEDIYNRHEYSSLHALADEWEIVNESEATPYLPEPVTRKIVVGIKKQETVDLPVGGTLRLGDHIESKRGFIINLGFSVFGLEFVTKRPEVDTSPHTQYLAVAGFRGAEDEHHLFSDFHPTGSYKNTIMIWRCECSVEKTAAEPVLDLCLLHDFGPIKEFKWCPYGTYEEVCLCVLFLPQC
ncbi:hypothetical protein BJV82DRAFT_503387 [Fennellomyces sp. T-0311]|nr:hypothetical protein BJV82DRAFT_503387 [Fennellomyces sp. T-0311]